MSENADNSVVVLDGGGRAEKGDMSGIVGTQSCLLFGKLPVREDCLDT